MKKYNVAVVGATGVVGSEIIKVLEEFDFPVNKLIPLASKRSTGKMILFKKKNQKVELLDEESFNDVDIALFSAGAAISQKYAPIAVKAGAIVIDNTSFYRMDESVPLVVPEVNPEAVKNHNGIIANPNCSTAQLVLALKPIHDAYKINRVIVSTYQATSGAGKEAMKELANQTAGILNGKGVMTPDKFTKQIAFNLIPHIDEFMDNDYTKEEMKMTNEAKKILEDDSIELMATCVRVPVFIGHSESVNIDVDKNFKIEDVKKCLAEFPGIKLVDNPKKNEYPTPIDCVETNDTLIGRVRRDITTDKGMTMFIVSNNLRKGAASNAVQIAMELVKQKLV